MSDIPRYEVEGCMEPSNEGCFVMWSDYKKLKAENERQKRELECAELNWRRQYEARAEMGKKMQFLSDDRIKIIAKQVALQAENERLRKAGDKMDAYLKRQDGTTNGMLDCRVEWLTAKGVQP